MDVMLLLARLFLAGVFMLSAVTKLVDPAGSRRAMAGFGVPERFTATAAIALPIAELVIAILLIPTATAWWGALAGLLLLFGFLAGIIYNLRQGRTPDCHCFGQLHSEPIGVPTLIRDGLFATAAAFIVLFGWSDPGASSIAWFGDLSSWERVLTIAAFLLVVGMAVQSWVQFQMLRQDGRLLLRLDTIDQRLDGVHAPPAPDGTSVSTPNVPIGLPEGSAAPAFQLEGLYGETQTLDALRAAGKPVLLVFSTPTCGPCNALMPEIGRWQRDHASHLTVAVIGSGEPAANRAKSAEHGLINVLLQQRGEVSGLYHAGATPTAVLVNPDGTIGSLPVPGADAIRALVSRAVTAIAPAPTPVAAGRATVADPVDQSANNGVHAPDSTSVSSDIGAPPIAPPINLPDLKGQTVALSEFAGQPTVVLFWNPGCGFCQRMLDDLKTWEANPPAGAPQLLVVSTGPVEANRAQEFRSPVVIDQGFATGNAYGASGTPSAVLVDRDGTIAGAIAVGAPRVLAMLSGEELVPDEPSAPPVTLAIGDPAPPISLPDLDGKTVELSDFAGRPTVVLFWNPGCVFCQRMVEDLRAWEENPPPDAPRLLVVSDGDVDANRGVGLRSPIVREDGFATGRSYGASGTPSGRLVDAEGNIASQLVVGAAKVLSLAGYVSAGCRSCLETCEQQGGGAACQTVCEMGGQCP